ncbi:MAG TPA: DUF1573 domain-containing protein [Bacteroidales bacterium]|nr:DUF1573 domain-containing protein [Bacteroidales bacterium]
MKKVLLLSLISIILLSFNTLAQNAQKKGPGIKFEALEYDYGTIYQGADGGCEFKFKNTGDEPLILSSVRSSCGCTVPNWPKDPILPGQNGTIKVTYDTKRIGTISKQISVVSNASEPNLTLSIKGTVLQKPNEILPEKQVNQGFTPTPNQ